MKPANVLSLPSPARPAEAPRVASRAMRDALAQLITASARYAESYAAARRAPIGCDPVRGPILLDVLRGIAALGDDDRDHHDRVVAVISDHALDLEE